MIIYVYLLFHKAPQIIKIVILVNLSPMFLALAPSILAWKIGKLPAFPTASKIARVLFSDPTNLLFSCLS